MQPTIQKGTPEYVVFHGLKKIKKGKNPSAILAPEFGGIKNPKIAFAIAQALTKDTAKTLLGKPFLRKEINWADEYKNHLAGPEAHIPFGPINGISRCECAHCFYRDAPREYNPKNDCQIVGNNAKKFFGIPNSMVMPKKIAGKEVGNFCPNYLDWDAE